MIHTCAIIAIRMHDLCACYDEYCSVCETLISDVMHLACNQREIICGAQDDTCARARELSENWSESLLVLVRLPGQVNIVRYLDHWSC